LGQTPLVSSVKKNSAEGVNRPCQLLREGGGRTGGRKITKRRVRRRLPFGARDWSKANGRITSVGGDERPCEHDTANEKKNAIGGGSKGW